VKTIVITGANTGIGRATAEGLADAETKLVLAGRSLERTQPVIDACRARGCEVEFVELDLTDLAQTRGAAKRVLAHSERIDVLINNAGVAGVHGVTKNGFELHLGVNHLGHFAWTMALLPRLRENHSRVITVASEAHRGVKRLDFVAFERATGSKLGWTEYCESKLCNILFASELARRYSELTCVSLHPGVIASDLWRHVPKWLKLFTVFMKSNNDGARTSIFCATSGTLTNGAYYDKSKPRTPNRAARNATLARELWTRSESLIRR
jgi:retinol dehydrogenase-12